LRAIDSEQAIPFKEAVRVMCRSGQRPQSAVHDLFEQLDRQVLSSLSASRIAHSGPMQPRTVVSQCAAGLQLMEDQRGHQLLGRKLAGRTRSGFEMAAQGSELSFGNHPVHQTQKLRVLHAGLSSLPKKAAHAISWKSGHHLTYRHWD